jgi:hypothetical protein
MAWRYGRDYFPQQTRPAHARIFKTIILRIFSGLYKPTHENIKIVPRSTSQPFYYSSLTNHHNNIIIYHSMCSWRCVGKKSVYIKAHVEDSNVQALKGHHVAMYACIIAVSPLCSHLKRDVIIKLCLICIFCWLFNGHYSCKQIK